MACDKGHGGGWGTGSFQEHGWWLRVPSGHPPSLSAWEGTGPMVMPFVLALGLGAAAVSEEMQ